MRSSFLLQGTLAALFLAVFSIPARAEPDGNDDRPVRRTPETETIISKLSDDERLRLREAVNAIWTADEVVKRRAEMQEANLAYRKALQQEVRKMDGSQKIRGVLLRLLQMRFRQEGSAGSVPGERDGEHDRVRPGGGQKPPAYSEQERSIIDTARKEAEVLPAVKEARRRLDMAVTARERNAAAGEYRKTMREAMEKADPRIGEIFGRRDRHPWSDRR